MNVSSKWVGEPDYAMPCITRAMNDKTLRQRVTVCNPSTEAWTQLPNREQAEKHIWLSGLSGHIVIVIVIIIVIMVIIIVVIVVIIIVVIVVIIINVVHIQLPNRE